MNVEWKYVPKVGEIIYSEKNETRYTILPTIGSSTEGYTLWCIIGHGYELQYVNSSDSIPEVINRWCSIVYHLDMNVVHGVEKTRLFGDKFISEEN